MSMEVPHAHIRESAESISVIFFVYLSFGVFFPLFVYRFSPYCGSTVAVLGLSTFFKIYALLTELP
jgi:VIT1/CCC1 family predicted Fe2+/Mn2+ transporter